MNYHMASGMMLLIQYQVCMCSGMLQCVVVCSSFKTSFVCVRACAYMYKRVCVFVHKSNTGACVSVRESDYMINESALPISHEVGSALHVYRLSWYISLPPTKHYISATQLDDTSVLCVQTNLTSPSPYLFYVQPLSSFVFAQITLNITPLLPVACKQ